MKLAAYAFYVFFLGVLYALAKKFLGFDIETLVFLLFIFVALGYLEIKFYYDGKVKGLSMALESLQNFIKFKLDDIEKNTINILIEQSKRKNND